MKKNIIILALCFVTVYAVTDAEKKCFDEIGVTPEEFETKFADMATELQNKFLCCSYKTPLGKDETLYSFLKDAAEEMKKSSIPTSSDATPEILLSKLNQCKEKAGDDDCKLFNCINVYEPPFSKIVIPFKAH